MDAQTIGNIIKRLREEKGLTQLELADMIYVSDKTISKWETGKGFPDITLLEPIAKALSISVSELLLGNNITNTNRSFNMQKLKFYVCPICSNVIVSTGEGSFSCCGIKLDPIEAEKVDGKHNVKVEKVEDDYFVSLSHEMTKDHYISFIASVSDDGYELKKLYPESEASARFKISRSRALYLYCNHHGLFSITRKELKDLTK